MQYWLDKMYTLYIFFSGLMGISIQDRKKFLLQVTRKDSLDDLTVCRGCLFEPTRLSCILDDVGRKEQTRFCWYAFDQDVETQIAHCYLYLKTGEIVSYVKHFVNLFTLTRIQVLLHLCVNCEQLFTGSQGGGTNFYRCTQKYKV